MPTGGELVEIACEAEHSFLLLSVQQSFPPFNLIINEISDDSSGYIEVQWFASRWV